MATWGSIIRTTAKKLPEMNHDLLKYHHRHQIDNMVDELQALFRQTLREIANNMEWGPDVFKYVGYRELCPEERVATLQSTARKKFERRYDINQTNKRVMAFKFVYMGEYREMRVDLPYIDNYCIHRFGTPYYPIFAIADKGGIGYMRNNQILVKVMRARLIFHRAKIVYVDTIEGRTLSEYLVTAKINQSSKGCKEPPPLVLHHLTTLGFTGTMKLYGVEKAIEIVESETLPKLDEKYYHVKLNNNCYIRLTKEYLTTNALRVLVGLYTVCSFYPRYDYKRLIGRDYYVIVTGRWSDTSCDYELYLAGNAETYLSMNETLIDPQYRQMHNSIGIEYQTLDELVLFLFNNIDRLVSDHDLGRVDMFRKRLAGCDAITEELIKIVNRRMFNVVRPRGSADKSPPNMKQLLNPVTFVRTFKNINVFRNSYTFYNDNMLAVAGLRFTAMTNTDVNGKSMGKKAQVSPAMLVSHYSHPAVVSIMTYPASSPIISGSLNPFVKVDKHANIQPPFYLEELKSVYGDVLR